MSEETTTPTHAVVTVSPPAPYNSPGRLRLLWIVRDPRGANVQRCEGSIREDHRVEVRQGLQGILVQVLHKSDGTVRKNKAVPNGQHEHRNRMAGSLDGLL